MGMATLAPGQQRPLLSTMMEKCTWGHYTDRESQLGPRSAEALPVCHDAQVHVGCYAGTATIKCNNNRADNKGSHMTAAEALIMQRALAKAGTVATPLGGELDHQWPNGGQGEESNCMHVMIATP